MRKQTVVSVDGLNLLLRQIAKADDPGEPLREVGIDLGDLTEPHRPKGTRRPSTPYARLIERVMTSGFSGPKEAFDALMAVLSFLDELLGPHQSVVQLIDDQWTHRLLVALMVTLRLQEPDPWAISLEELLLVR